MKNSTFDLPAALKEMRSRSGATQREVARAVRYSHSAYQTWEQGGADPKITACVALADYFDVSLDELIGRVRRGD